MDIPDARNQCKPRARNQSGIVQFVSYSSIRVSFFNHSQISIRQIQPDPARYPQNASVLSDWQGDNGILRSIHDACARLRRSSPRAHLTAPERCLEDMNAECWHAEKLAGHPIALDPPVPISCGDNFVTAVKVALARARADRRFACTMPAAAIVTQTLSVKSKCKEIGL